MWDKIEVAFGDYPAQKKVVLYLLERGLGVTEDGKISCDGCIIPSTSIARRLGVDRRVVDSAAQRILENADLKRVYRRLKSIVFLRDLAPEIGLGVVSISVKDARKPGIIEGITNCIARHGVNIRQAVAEDTYFVDNPTFTVITEEPVRGKLLEALKKIEGVSSITIA